MQWLHQAPKFWKTKIQQFGNPKPTITFAMNLEI
jgi:hypothetical protein